MVIDQEQEHVLLELLNTTPVVDGAVQDQLNASGAKAWQRAHGGNGTEEERGHLVRARGVLQDTAGGNYDADALSELLDGVAYRPRIGDEGLVWDLDAPPARRVAVQAVLTWFALHRTKPGRLRPCANPECRLFLLDRSKPNKARWCSMAVCGNRMKARRHYQRAREEAAE
ncbi:MULTISPECIES: CGNR zinc finger domain-containing protein [unclassified Streptomyces]|uniref:CGNR zinc finger domain-containing protein n=1 Tax=unclassified Streptomyces TaxID=2593676 RepID=UPI0036463E7A